MFSINTSRPMKLTITVICECGQSDLKGTELSGLGLRKLTVHGRKKPPHLIAIHCFVGKRRHFSTPFEQRQPPLCTIGQGRETVETVLAILPRSIRCVGNKSVHTHSKPVQSEL